MKPGPKRRTRQEAIAFVLEHSIPEPNSGCLLWLGHTSFGGYGQTNFDGKQGYTHRLICNAQPGEVARHSCDTPCCVEKKHILRGTHADNVADKVAKGRQPKLATHYTRQTRAQRVLINATLEDFGGVK